MEHRNNLLAANLNTIDIYAKHINTYFDGDDINTYMKDMEALVRTYSELDEEWKLGDQVLTEIDTDIGDIDTVFATKLSAVMNENSVEQHPFLNAFKDRIKAAPEPVLMDVVISDEGFKPIRDPITKSYITNPIRNKNCGHIYENGPIQKMIAQNKKVKCPYVGCAAKSYLSMQILEPDVETAKKIQNYNIETSSAAASN